MARTKEFNETEVLEKAVQVFWEKGYNGTSMQDLVERLGINRASLYATFGDKHRLFEKAVLKYRESTKNYVQNYLYSHTSVKEGFLKLFIQSMDESLSDENSKGCFMVNSTTELIPHDSKILCAVDQNRLEFEEIFFDYLNIGVKNHEISPKKDIKAISSYLFLLQNGLKVITKFDKNRNKLIKSIKLALSVLD
ncbi:MAG: TetR/AcrR family transcriptional regulator [Leptospiraceae bacterium]|nr:TetR/AcrR family transcriptional regulator [Leptospiraceae bacterium]